MTTIADPIEAGLRGGWKVVDASRAERDLELDADVAIVGSGAGGGTAAEILASAGLCVVLLLASTGFAAWGVAAAAGARPGISPEPRPAGWH